MNKSHKISYTVEMEYAEHAEALLVAYSHEGFEECVLPSGKTVFTLYAELDENNTTWHNDITEKLQKECNALVEYTVTDIISWVERWKETCKPVYAGNFYIVPEWYSGDIPHGVYPIYITPRMAFGTGHHATTALCLKALSSDYINEHILQGTFADIGTGSGILSIALALLGMKGDAVDIDNIAIENARENALHNNVSDALSFYVGDIGMLPNDTLYRLVTANIVADVLIPLSSTLAQKMEKKGLCILSGILVMQMDTIIKQYEKEGFRCLYREKEGEWSACLLEYNG